MNEENGPLSQEEIDALLQALQTETSSSSSAQADASTNTPKAEDFAGEMNGENPLPAPDQPEPDISRQEMEKFSRWLKLPVQVRVDVGEKEITVKDWMDVGVGSRIVLNERWREALVIRLNGYPVGSGKVVVVDNRLGIQIERWGGDFIQRIKEN
ncbi:MAG: FliM/FliN family flagellar motor switch protein [Firmicutes bacterium]|nr:FliM/FliN family flagellar motor switch protein [Bacillota bacterium]